MKYVDANEAEAIEPDEFHRLLLRELDALHRLAYHLTYRREEAEDLVQETYLRAFKSRAAYRTTERGPRPYLFKILHNVYRTRLGKKKLERVTAEDVDGEIAAPPEAPTVSIDWEQVDDRLKGAIESLPAAHRGVLLMWAVDGLKYREIADVTDVPVGTVMSRLHRARQAVLSQVTDLAEEHRLRPAPRAVAVPAPEP